MCIEINIAGCNMVNLTKPRKVNESKSQLKRAAKSTGRLEVGSSFSEILLTFETTVCSDGKVRQSDNQIVSNAVRQLLSSLQSLIKRKAEVRRVEEGDFRLC